ncbi:MAG: hypothetical protein AAFY76_04755, partial [Cyanobacteria bacterium J06649_11]
MSRNISKSIPKKGQQMIQRIPQPGEIWEVNRSIYCPVEFSQEQKNQLYSNTTRQFLAGNSAPINVMVVNQEVSDKFPQELPVISVMLLSQETEFLSNVDLLIPSYLSGLSTDILAHTWLIEEMFVCNLIQPVGKRLSRNIYDLLLDVGDSYHQIIDQTPENSIIERSGLKIGTRKAIEDVKIIDFHQRKFAFSDFLSVPVAAYRNYLQSIEFTEAVLEEAVEVERELLVSEE